MASIIPLVDSMAGALIGRRVAELEEQIQNGPYFRKGEALKAFKEAELYRPQYPNFAGYCSGRWGFTDERARQLMASSDVIRALQSGDPTSAQMLPASESLVRPLAGLSDKWIRLIWDYVWFVVPGRITAEQIKILADQARAGGPLRLVTVADIPDCKWPSDDPLDMPLLILDGQAKSIDLPLVCWGSSRRDQAGGVGTYHFYTEDRRYMALWNDPTPVINSLCKVIIEPNFSIYDNTPRIAGLYRIYLKRWLARWWQSYGIAVVVDLNVSPQFANDNLLGVPHGWRAYATRGRVDKLESLDRDFDLACDRAGTKRDLLFVVYGGGRAVAERARARGWLHFPEQIQTL